MNKVVKRVIIITLIVIVILVSVFFLYFEAYYHADKSVNDYLKSSDTVIVIKNKKYYFFDGPSKENAIIFYPGAKVETESYARLMYKLAENGVDCFLLDIPFRFAFFGVNYPNYVKEKDSYSNLYLMGHSLGGVVASNYIYGKSNYSGIIFLASYPNKKLSNNLNVISIYGENDKVLNLKSYKNNNWPVNYIEFIIPGGNHAGFANYGKQNGDGENTISCEEQQDETVSLITRNIK